MTRSLSIYHNIHVHSEYSILDGVGFTDEYAKIAKEAKMGYVCLTDHGMAAGWPSLIDSCRKFGLRPVFGLEAYVNDYHDLVPKFSTLTDEMKRKVRKSDHVLLIAENEKGLENLIRLVTLSWEKGFYYKPRVSFAQIAAHSEGVVATSGCFSSPINQALAAEDLAGARDLMRRWSEVFHGRFWIEWMMIDWEKQEQNNARLFDIAEETGLPPLITNDCHYSSREHAQLQKIQLLIQSKSGTIDDPRGLVFDSDRLWFTTETEMDERWDSKYKAMYGRWGHDIYERSKLETLKICQRCGYVKIDTSPKLPEIPDADAKLRTMCEEMMCKLSFNWDPKYVERLDEELELISVKGFSSYFITQKIIVDAACDKLGSPRSPGRGSVGGSLVAYLLKITQLDPLVHGTLFSRFLSPSRGGEQMVLMP